MRARGTDGNGFSGSAAAAAAPAPGKRTLTEALPMVPPAASGGERVAQLMGERAQAPASPDVHAVHDRLGHSTGAPLDPQIAGPMGIELGHDLGGVKVHDNAVSHQITTEMGARAMTVGADVYFDRGQYQPTTDTGRELIGHELRASAGDRTGELARRVPGRLDRCCVHDVSVDPFPLAALAVTSGARQIGAHAREGRSNLEGVPPRSCTASSSSIHRSPQ